MESKDNSKRELEIAAEQLASTLQRIGGCVHLNDELRKEHNKALDYYFEITDKKEPDS